MSKLTDVAVQLHRVRVAKNHEQAQREAEQQEKHRSEAIKLAESALHSWMTRDHALPFSLDDVSIRVVAVLSYGHGSTYSPTGPERLPVEVEFDVDGLPLKVKGQIGMGSWSVSWAGLPEEKLLPTLADLGRHLAEVEDPIKYGGK